MTCYILLVGSVVLVRFFCFLLNPVFAIDNPLGVVCGGVRGDRVRAIPGRGAGGRGRGRSRSTAAVDPFFFTGRSTRSGIYRRTLTF